jgi:hypothetical protein
VIIKLIFLALTITFAVEAKVHYTVDDPPNVNPAVRDITVRVNQVEPSVPGSGGARGALFSLSLQRTSTATVTTVVEDEGARLLDIEPGTQGLRVEPQIHGANHDGAWGRESIKGGYVVTSSPGGTYAEVLLPNITLYDADFDGVGDNPAAHTEVDIEVAMPHWQNYTWTGGPIPEESEDLDSHGPRGEAMSWREYTDDNATIPPIELTGTNHTLERANNKNLFWSGLLAGGAAAAAIALVAEFRRDKWRRNDATH